MSIIEDINVKNYLKAIKNEVKHILNLDITNLQAIKSDKLDKLIFFLKKRKNIIQDVGLGGRTLDTRLDDIIKQLENINSNIKNNNIDNFKENLAKLINYLEENSKFTGREKTFIGSIIGMILFFLSVVIILPIISHHQIKKLKNKNK